MNAWCIITSATSHFEEGAFKENKPLFIFQWLSNQKLKRFSFILYFDRYMYNNNLDSGEMRKSSPRKRITIYIYCGNKIFLLIQNRKPENRDPCCYLLSSMYQFGNSIQRPKWNLRIEVREVWIVSYDVCKIMEAFWCHSVQKIGIS